MELDLPLEAICRIILRAREYEAQVPDADEDDGSNPTDDEAVEVLMDEDNTAVEEELRAAIEDLAEDEQAALVALTYVGRGTFDASEWQDALDAANEELRDAADYLMGLPMMSAEIEAGLEAFGLSCDDVGQVA